MLSRSEITVLIMGETGTGKDCAAQAIHQLSNRRRRPMITVNCPALPENLLESELFGYTMGAFTNAHKNKRGLFEEAHGSTIFLDEIGDLSVSLQTKLLRVLQDKQIQPLGALASRTIDVRIIAATNRDLKQKMEIGQFREDLFYRLNVGTINMPPLNAIREDIPLLVEHFLKKAACELSIPAKQVSPELMDHLLVRDWPGNIRELENTIRRWCAMAVEETISIEVLAPEDRTDHKPDKQNIFNRPYKKLKEQTIEKFTRDYLNRLMKHTKGNVSLSAQISGIKRQSLQKIIKRYNLQIDQYRS
jgi:transcriptional regulator with PAS, ATPase and Fis domain